MAGYLKQQVETMANAGIEQGGEAEKMMEDDEEESVPSNTSAVEVVIMFMHGHW